ncbi:MAG: DUF2304 family protein [Blautia obeum]
MISLVFRVVLILCSLFTAIFIIRKIRQSKVQINYAIFWDSLFGMPAYF